MQDREGEIKAEASVHTQDKLEKLFIFRDCFH